MRVKLSVIILLFLFWVMFFQDADFKETEASAREFLSLLESPLNDLELRKSSAAKWLAQCEQVLQQAVEMLDPSTTAGLVICLNLDHFYVVFGFSSFDWHAFFLNSLVTGSRLLTLLFSGLTDM